MSTATMLIHCPDEKGIILSVTNYISRNNGNIVDLDQHVDSEQKIFFMRVEWTLSDFNIQEKILVLILVLKLPRNIKCSIQFTSEMKRLEWRLWFLKWTIVLMTFSRGISRGSGM